MLILYFNSQSFFYFRIDVASLPIPFFLRNNLYIQSVIWHLSMEILKQMLFLLYKKSSKTACSLFVMQKNPLNSRVHFLYAKYFQTVFALWIINKKDLIMLKWLWTNKNIYKNYVWIKSFMKIFTARVRSSSFKDRNVSDKWSSS